MIKIEIPVKRNRYSTQRRMMGNKMMMNKIINRNQIMVDENRLKAMVKELLRDNNKSIEIHRNKPNSWSLILSINLTENSQVYNVRTIVTIISKKYERFQFRNVWIL